MVFCVCVCLCGVVGGISSKENLNNTFLLNAIIIQLIIVGFWGWEVWGIGRV